MQDDTLGVSECGFKSRKMNSFLNTRIKIMGLQFGSEKCEKMHIGKKHVNPKICTYFEVDIWKDQLGKDAYGNNCLVGIHIGKRRMKTVNSKNILDKLFKGMGKTNLILKVIQKKLLEM